MKHRGLLIGLPFSPRNLFGETIFHGRTVITAPIPIATRDYIEAKRAPPSSLSPSSPLTLRPPARNAAWIILFRGILPCFGSPLVEGIPTTIIEALDNYFKNTIVYCSSFEK